MGAGSPPHGDGRPRQSVHRVGRGWGGSAANGGEWRCAFNCVPALDPAARALSVALPELPFLNGDGTVHLGPWTFTVPLDGILGARPADPPARESVVAQSREGVPILDALVEVIAVGQTQTRDGTVLSLLSAAGGGSAAAFHWRCAYAFTPALAPAVATVRLDGVAVPDAMVQVRTAGVHEATTATATLPGPWAFIVHCPPQ